MKYLALILPFAFTVNPLLANNKANEPDLCGAGFELPVRTKVSSKNISVTDKVSIFKKDYVAKYKKKGAKITVSLTCQTPQGTDFSGNNEELASFINSALHTLKNQGAKNIKFTTVPVNENYFEGKLNSKMYDFSAITANGKDVLIKNLYVFDPKLSTIYVASVTGNKANESVLLAEFNKFIKSLKIQNN